MKILFPIILGATYGGLCSYVISAPYVYPVVIAGAIAIGYFSDKLYDILFGDW
jgi:hypothetical protein